MGYRYKHYKTKASVMLGKIRSKETAMFALNEILTETGSSVKFLLVVVDKIKSFP